jgi:shikimate kinase
MIRLVGPGGAGKSTIGALLAERLDLTFIDLDRHLAQRVGDIGDYIADCGYETYARESVETYQSIVSADTPPDILALSSGFMTYSIDIHSKYPSLLHEIEQSPATFVLLPSVDRDVCVAETVRRQSGRPFGRSASREEAVIRARFEIYMAVSARKIETMRPAVAVLDEIVAALRPRCG